jgi:hypothetical protein
VREGAKLGRVVFDSVKLDRDLKRHRRQAGSLLYPLNTGHAV